MKLESLRCGGANVILEVTPHLTAGNLIRMQIRAERSGIQLLDSDLGVNFNVQEARNEHADRGRGNRSNRGTHGH